jgi:protein-disulfide isomerase
LSEQFSPESASSSQEPLEIQSIGSITEPATVPAPTSRPKWIAPAWFFFGILVGVIGFAAYTALIVKPTSTAAAAPTLDVVAMRNAARDGTLDAIATLQPAAAQQQQQQQQQQQPQGPQVVAANAFTVRDANREGNPDAKVTVYEFADYQCPFCKRNHDVVGPELRKQYVDSGKINIIFKHFTFLGQESIWAAQAAECAADQGKFWEYHDLLFAKQGNENGGTFTKENLIKYAQELKLDATKFDPCLNNDQTLERVKADTLEGRNAGVSGTPTFFINGKPLVGAQPIEAFKQVLDPLLAGQ